MRRRRRPAVTWLPSLGTRVTADQGQLNDTGVRAFRLALPANQHRVRLIIPLTFDTPQENDQAGAFADEPLVRFTGSEYFLRRLVGKLFLAIPETSIDEDRDTGVLIGAGFFIARAGDQSGGPTNDSDAPIGASIQPASYDPLHVDTIREPWIWRRVWILGGKNISAPGSSSNLDLGSYPPSNAHYGSVLDGPHFDAKTRRRVTSDDRLWFTVAAQNLNPDNTQQLLVDDDISISAVVLRGILDWRGVISMRKARNRGNF